MDGHELSLNGRAAALVQEMLARRRELRISAAEVAGATVVDCGVQAPGGWEAGLYFARICLADLACVALLPGEFGGRVWPAVMVATDYPALACLGSQYAGWSLRRDGYGAMGSGPARLLARVEELVGRLGYGEQADCAVLALEAGQLPSPAVIEYVAEKCGVPPSGLYVLVAPTASPVGSVQVAARMVETGLHKMLAVDYDPRRVVRAWGTCVVPPVAADDTEALGRTNDAVLYGSTVCYTVDDGDEALERLARELPSRASRDWGKPFGELWRQYGDFYAIDPHLFSPAEVCLSSPVSGRTFRAGSRRADLLARSFALTEIQGE